MKFTHLSVLALLCLALVGTEASQAAEDYWKSVWPNTPVPKVLEDLLLPYKETDLPIKVEEEKQYWSVFFEHELHPGKKMSLGSHDKHSDEKRTQPFVRSIWAEENRNQPFVRSIWAEEEEGRPLETKITHENRNQPFVRSIWAEENRNQPFVRSIWAEEEESQPLETKITHENRNQPFVRSIWAEENRNQPFVRSIWAEEEESRPLETKITHENRNQPFVRSIWAEENRNQPFVRSIWAEKEESGTIMHENRNQPFVRSIWAEKEESRPLETKITQEKGNQPFEFRTWQKEESQPLKRNIIEARKLGKEVAITEKGRHGDHAPEDECGNKVAVGEDKFCAKSLESMMDFAISKLGKDIHVKNSSFAPNQDQYVVEEVRKVGESAVMCHRLNYRNVVFYCHVVNATTTYMVPMVASDGSRATAVTICHHDTRGMNSQMLYEMLKVKSGTVPVCHFVGNKAAVWLPNSVAGTESIDHPCVI